MSTPDELLADGLGAYTENDRLDAFLKLHAECSKGNLPSEYLKALAARLRRGLVSVKDDPTTHFAYRIMADTLEAWADE